jgi:hypothetical protein
MNKKVACVIFMDEKYREARPFYAKNSVNSFKKWHPDVDLDVVGNDFDLSKMQNTEVRMQFVKQKFDDGYTKVIMLGADTITCSRMDEFLDDDVTPFLATCDSKMPFSMKFEPDCFFSPKHGVFEWAVINSDVCCFNNKEVIYEISRYIDIENDWHEQSSMTYLYTQRKDLVKIIDFPYEFTRVVYNNRGRGGLGADCIKDGKMFFGFDGPQIGEFTPIKVWKPIGDKLYNHDGKHVKAFHFCFHDKKEDAKKWFNDETVNFFINHCDCNWELPLYI